MIVIAFTLVLGGTHVVLSETETHNTRVGQGGTGHLGTLFLHKALGLIEEIA